MAPGVLAHDGHLAGRLQELGTPGVLKRDVNGADAEDELASLNVKPGEHLNVANVETSISFSANSNLIVSSPYHSPSHLLDLRTLSVQPRLFARALALMEPSRPDYATADYLDSFNWPVIMAKLRSLACEEGIQWSQQSFYTVIFRSKLNPNINRDLLRRLDEESHREAAESGGLLKYWFGVPNGERRNLATCLWRNREDARKGGLGPWHKKARTAARELYERIDFTTWELVIEDDISGWKLLMA